MFGHCTYLVFELAWALPVIALHWALDRRRLWARRRVIALACGAATVYLTLADAVALHAGIWALHADRILGIRIGTVPIEESIFFLVTNLMVVQSLIVLQPREARARRARAAT
ncbi:MAG TPA: lycopene cyclase domain-containing protein [Chloroflexota bacterium]|jgi:lycopene cyclase domain-containing protein|nr:lycopene cyclase domain-containing protein [Chloroflexota bacterium]